MRAARLADSSDVYRWANSSDVRHEKAVPKRATSDVEELVDFTDVYHLQSNVSSVVLVLFCCRFFGMVRDLTLWMSDMILQMETQERPRDVSGVELLMNNHQSLKAEIDARDENFTICVNLGKDLLARKHYRSPEVSERAVSKL